MINLNKETFKQTVLMVTVIVLLAGSIIAGNVFIEKQRCYESWKESGFKSKYSYTSKCLVEVHPGEMVTWFHDQRYFFNKVA